MYWNTSGVLLASRATLTAVGVAVLIAGCGQLAPGRKGRGPILAVDHGFSFTKEPFIHPNIIQDLSTWLSDTGDQVVTISLVDAQDSSRYFGEVLHTSQPGGRCPYVYTGRRNEGESFGYRYVGMTESGVHVLYTSDWGGGSGVFKDIMLLTIEHDYAVDCCHWDGLTTLTTIKAEKRRVLVRKLGAIALGDRWDGELSIAGNELHVGKDVGWFSSSGESGGGALSDRSVDRILKIDVRPSNPLDFVQHKPPCS